MRTNVLAHSTDADREQPGRSPTAPQVLVVSHNTVAKAYSELQHEGLFELRHGSGAYISARRNSKSNEEKLRLAQQRVRRLVESLREDGLSEEAISRLFEAELFYAGPPAPGAG